MKITNARENEFVLALARKSAPSRKQVWIGLMWTANGFYWSDYSVPVYKAWAPKEPNGNSHEPCGNMWTRQSSASIRPNGLIETKLRPNLTRPVAWCVKGSLELLTLEYRKTTLGDGTIFKLNQSINCKV